jgi:hypothetical protein
MALTTYQRRKAAGVCASCGGPPRPGKALCLPCQRQKDGYTAAPLYAPGVSWDDATCLHGTGLQLPRPPKPSMLREPFYDAPGPLVGCGGCGTRWYAVTQVPFATPCCGWTLALQKETA